MLQVWLRVKWTARRVLHTRRGTSRRPCPFHSRLKPTQFCALALVCMHEGLVAAWEPMSDVPILPMHYVYMHGILLAAKHAGPAVLRKMLPHEMRRH